MNKRYFDLARKISLKSSSEFRLGCVIADKSKVITWGYNFMNKTHPKSKTFGNFLHSELHALIGTNYKDTVGATAYIYRETRNGELANAKPCPVCRGALYMAGIKQICYTTNSGYEMEKL